MEGRALVELFAAEGRGGGLLAEGGGGSHLSAGHAIDAVVDEDDGDGLAAVGGVDDLGGADGGEIAIALIADDDAAGTAALDGGGDCGTASVGDLHVADVEIVIGEDGTADGADEDGAVLNGEFVDGFGEELVYYAVSAAGTVVRLLLEFALTLEGVVEGVRALVGDGVTSLFNHG